MFVESGTISVMSSGGVAYALSARADEAVPAVATLAAISPAIAILTKKRFIFNFINHPPLKSSCV
jgi:hypothetical protein